MPTSAVFTLQLGVVDPRLIERTILDVEGMSTWAHHSLRNEIRSLFPQWWGLPSVIRGGTWSGPRGDRAAIAENLRLMLESISYTPTFHLAVEGRQAGASVGARLRFTDTNGVTATPVKRLAGMVTEYLADAPREVQEAGYARFPLTSDNTVRVPWTSEINVGFLEPIAPVRTGFFSGITDGYPTQTPMGLSSYPYVSLNRYQGAHASSLITKTVTMV